jgi:hypothetical protein
VSISSRVGVVEDSARHSQKYVPASDSSLSLPLVTRNSQEHPAGGLLVLIRVIACPGCAPSGLGAQRNGALDQAQAVSLLGLFDQTVSRSSSAERRSELRPMSHITITEPRPLDRPLDPTPARATGTGQHVPHTLSHPTV